MSRQLSRTLGEGEIAVKGRKRHLRRPLKGIWRISQSLWDGCCAVGTREWITPVADPGGDPGKANGTAFEAYKANVTKPNGMIDRLQHSMRALQMFMRAQEVTANNLANINTPGFKGDKLFYRALQDELNGRPVSGTEAHQTMRMEQGSFESTGNPFDFAIEGEGFFEVESEKGRFLTRNGRFRLDSDGYMVDEQGSQVMGQTGPIHLPQFIGSGAVNSDVNIQVEKDGTVKVEGESVARLRVVRVDQVHTLQRRTNSYLAVPPGTEVISDESSQVVQGYYESGNVDPLMELVEMTKNMRLFESQQRIMQTTNEMLSQVTTQLGRF